MWVSEPHFGEVRGDARPWLMVVGKPIVDFLFAFNAIYWTFFSLSRPIRILELWREICTARLLSQGVDLFALKFYVDKVVPINHSWLQKT